MDGATRGVLKVNVDAIILDDTVMELGAVVRHSREDVTLVG